MTAQVSKELQNARNDLWSAVMRCVGDDNEKLHVAIEKIDNAVQRGAHPDECTDEFGRRLLDAMCSQGGLNARAIAAHLCRRGANPLLGGLVHRLCKSYSTVSTVLISEAARGDLRDEEGGCVLHGIHLWANSGADEEWLYSLFHAALTEGASMDVRDHSGRSALEKLWSKENMLASLPDDWAAHNIWYCTNLLHEKGFISEEIVGDKVLGLVELSGFAPGECPPDEATQQSVHYPVMDVVFSALQKRAIAARTPSVSAQSPSRRF